MNTKEIDAIVDVLFDRLIVGFIFVKFGLRTAFGRIEIESVDRSHANVDLIQNILNRKNISLNDVFRELIQKSHDVAEDIALDQIVPIKNIQSKLKDIMEAFARRAGTAQAEKDLEKFFLNAQNEQSDKGDIE